MAENMSAAAIEVLIQTLKNVFKEELSLIRDLDGDAKQLQETLDLIQKYLNDAEKKSITDDAVTTWLNNLEALAFDADNVLDALNYHLLHKKFKKMIKTPKRKVLLSCFSSFNHIARRRNMALRIKQINTSFHSMNEKASELGLQSMVVSAPPATHVSLETDSITLDPIFIGRDDDVPELVEILLSESVEEQILSIIAIVGMGGMGKTTLTRKVFNHEKMNNRFGSLNWVHVSDQPLDPIILLKKILSVLTSSQTSDGLESREVIMKKLQEALKDKTYLLVLDDVWNEDLQRWEEFVNAITGVTSTRGNGIIMTTRNEKVASMVRPLHSHHLNGLSDEECWSIIKAKAFENGDVVQISRFEMVGRKIAKRCGGLPLAANVIGGVLRCKPEQDEWRLINENWVSEGENDISNILKLSFDNLPSPSLKKCFAYCSVFPKGDEIEVQRLIELWMAEGFLQSDKVNEMETVGNKFVNVFLHNSLLLVGERDEYGNVKKCTMHDLVHDLATSVLGNDSNGLKQARYVIHYSHHSNPIPKESAKYLRTLILWGEISGTIFSDFESLHVLTLSRHTVVELPSSIRKLIHLRKLDISHTNIKNLPEWIGELHHLQTLRAEGVKKMPTGLKYLSNLRHLYIDKDTQLPAEIGRLTCLQTLRYFAVDDREGYRIEELGSLKCLKGELDIRNLEKVHGREEAEKAKIFQKRDLLKLTFRWNENREVERNDESVLEGLQPYHNLKTIEIRGFQGKRFPLWTQKMAVRDDRPQGSWIGLDKLIRIELDNCDECEEIPRLDHLPNLKYLSLIRLKKVRFITTSPFNKLTEFYIDGLEELECLPDLLFYNNQNMSTLSISRCPKLETLPDGLHTLNSLKHLNISICRNLKSMGNPCPSGGEQSQLGILLEYMEIRKCESLMELPHQMVESFGQSLTSLKLVGLSSLKNMPVVIDCIAKSARLTPLRLQELAIDVSMESCVAVALNIKESVDDILQGCCNSLLYLRLRGMENWEWVPTSIQQLTRLTWLWLINFGFEELPELSENLSSLWRLHLKNCKKLRRLPTADSLRLLNNFEYLYVKDCPELHINSELLHDIPHLNIEVDGETIKTSTE